MNAPPWDSRVGAFIIGAMTPAAPPSFAHWPHAVRSAALLTGTLVRCGPGERAVGWPDTPRARCAALAQQLAGTYIAAEETAAWVWGTARDPGSPLSLITQGTRAPATFELGRDAQLIKVKHFRLYPGDVEHIDGHRVTTPERTLYDLLRSPEPFTAARRVASRLLLRMGSDAPTGVQARVERSSFADRARAHRRIAELTGKPSAGRPHTGKPAAGKTTAGKHHAG